MPRPKVSDQLQEPLMMAIPIKLGFSDKCTEQHAREYLRRHSSWRPADWQKLNYFYRAAFGSAIKGLE